MSTEQILLEIQTLTFVERRALACRIFEMDEDGQILADCDRRADENFQMLDRMEAEDAATPAR